MRFSGLLSKMASAGFALLMCAAMPGLALAQGVGKDAEKAGIVDTSGIDFGDDTSRWANDGECDDPRFTGPGADENLQEVDRLHDATDCRAALQAGRVSLSENGDTAGIDFGDDTSQYANDGECDDPRFTGAGAAANNVEADLGHDATDCKTAYDAGTITSADTGTAVAGVDFGDDTSQYANDGECDDPRFTGTGAAANNVEADLGHDATDCKTAYDAGTVTLAETGTTETGTAAGIDFGDDTSDWANDNECDDPRFSGTGAAANNVEADLGHDATDCKTAYDAGTVTFAGESGTGGDTGGEMAGVDFGDDTSQYANDGECDDPRFTGPGAAANNVEADLGHDATDCKTAFDASTITLADPGSDADDVARINFGDDTSQYANDGECDDPRFSGTGAAANNVEADLGHDATDCKTAYEAGNLVLQQATGADTSEPEVVPQETPMTEPEVTPETTPDTAPTEETPAEQTPVTETTGNTSGVDFGANDGQWTNDGQCDDPRFSGVGAATEQVEADLMHDADDCRAAYEAGTVTLTQGTSGTQTTTPVGQDRQGTTSEETRPETTPTEQVPVEQTPTEQTTSGGTQPTSGSIDFGDDTGAWANDGDCDDPRFGGAGVADFVVSVDILKDASDCSKAVDAGSAALKPVYAADYASKAPYSEDGMDFGDNTSPYSSNDQCDDPRFEGPGMATSMLQSDIGHDSVDCRAAFIAGKIALKPTT